VRPTLSRASQDGNWISPPPGAWAATPKRTA